MKDIINSFKAHLYERTSSPLLGAFIFYWIICNYKLIMIIFDNEMKLNEKFDFIKSIYPQNKFTLWNGFDIYYQVLFGNGLLIPLLITLIYILLLPFASNYIYSLWIKHQNNLKRISNEKVLTKKEFGDLQRRFTELELSFDDTFSKKDNDITQLKNLLNKKEDLVNQNKTLQLKELEEKDKEIKFLNDKLIALSNNVSNQPKEKNSQLVSNEGMRILEYIGENPDNNTTILISELNLKRIEIESICDELITLECIIVNDNYANGDRVYRITDKGRKILLEYFPF